MIGGNNIDYDWNRYRKRMEGPIGYWKYNIQKRTGHEPTDDEAWAYLAWCADVLIQHILGGVETDALPMVQDLSCWVSDKCSDNYRASITGTFDPPSTIRYESPEAFQATKDDMVRKLTGGNVSPAPETSTGRAGYL